jgi:hypothetical protein
MELRSQSSDAGSTPSNKEFQMAAPGPGDSGARRKPAAGMFLLLIAVIAIVLVVVLF